MMCRAVRRWKHCRRKPHRPAGSLLAVERNERSALSRLTCRLIAVSLLAACGCRPGESHQQSLADPVSQSEADSVRSDAEPFRFRDRAIPAGVTFIPSNGAAFGQRTILETLGTGVAVWDFDLDGDEDLFFCGGGDFAKGPQIVGKQGALYRNHGNWMFEDVTESSGLADASLYSHGAAVGDFDNDGDGDLIVTGFGGLQLWVNQGDGTFSREDAARGIASDQWNTSAAWVDINADGWLDLYVARYVDWSFQNHPFCAGTHPGERDVCPPGAFRPVPDLLLLSDGQGMFRDASQEFELARDGMGLAVLAADLNLDGRTDLYVANDTTPNHLYWNRSGGRLEEAGVVSGTALGDRSSADGSMGVDVCDFNQDGLPDLFVSNFEDQSFALYRNDGRELFQQVSDRMGISSVGAVFVGFGTVAGDLDGDGDEDLFATNGHVMHTRRNAPFEQRPLLFRNEGGQRFSNVADQVGPYFQASHLGRGVARWDADQDGDLDLVVTHMNQPPALLENLSEARGTWLRVTLVGTRSNRSAIGTRIVVSAGDRRWHRQVTGGGSFLSSSSVVLHVAADPAAVAGEPLFDRVEVYWPSGIVQQLMNVAGNQAIRVTEPPRE